MLNKNTLISVSYTPNLPHVVQPCDEFHLDFMWKKMKILGLWKSCNGGMTCAWVIKNKKIRSRERGRP